MSALARYHQNGFSLLELVIAMVLTALLAVMAMQPVLRALQARAQVAGNLATIDTLRFVTERIVRELRQVRYDAQGNGFQLIALDPVAGAGNASSGLCFSRVGGSGGTTYANLAIRRHGTTASLDNVSWPGCVALSPKTLADNVSTLRFDYWSYGSGMPMALALNDSAFGTKLAFIDVTLSVIANGGPAVSYRSRIVLRNGAWGTVK